MTQNDRPAKIQEGTVLRGIDFPCRGSAVRCHRDLHGVQGQQPEVHERRIKHRDRRLPERRAVPSLQCCRSLAAVVHVFRIVLPYQEEAVLGKDKRRAGVRLPFLCHSYDPHRKHPFAGGLFLVDALVDDYHGTQNLAGSEEEDDKLSRY